MNRYLDVAPEVQEALKAGKPVVALESTIISHGMPYPQNVETALNVEKIIRDGGAVPATIAVIGGASLFGGVGTVIGTIGGAMVLAIIANVLNLAGVSPFSQQVVKGAIIILAVLLEAGRKPRK